MTGEQAPDFTLEHIDTGRPVSLADYRGRSAVVIVGGQNSSEQARRIDQTIRSRCGFDELPRIWVLHLSGVPRMMRGIVRQAILRSYRDAVHEIVAERRKSGEEVPKDRSRLVVMLCDWEGQVVARYGFGSVEEQAAAVLIGAAGEELGVYRGDGAGEEVLAFLDGIPA